MDTLDAEIAEERNREYIGTHYDSWLSDNIDSLQKEFFTEQKKADNGSFPDDATYKDVEEYYPDEFNEYCRDAYRSEE